MPLVLMSLLKLDHQPLARNGLSKGLLQLEEGAVGFTGLGQDRPARVGTLGIEIDG